MIATQTPPTEAASPVGVFPTQEAAATITPQAEVPPTTVARPAHLTPEALAELQPLSGEKPSETPATVGRARVEAATRERGRTFAMLGITALVIGAGALTSMGIAQPDRMGHVVSTAHAVIRDPAIGDGFDAALRLAGNTAAVATEIALPVIGEVATLATEAVVESPAGKSALTPDVPRTRIALAAALEIITAGVFPGHVITAGEQTLRDIPKLIAAFQAFGHIIFDHRNVKKSDLVLAA